jgi:5-(carboxyamino)imidazole ribonucleotide mutase
LPFRCSILAQIFVMAQSQTTNAAIQTVLVGVIMGSDSDLPLMQAAADMLTHFEIAFELTIVSAHRTPQRMFEYAQTAKGRGLKVIIAGAGGAAHLPGWWLRLLLCL